MATLTELLANLDSDSGVKGRQFERICSWLLRSAPEYAQVVRQVWLWDEWPDRPGRDMGVDLVAELHSGELWAVQAKAYAPDHTVRKGDIDSFLSASATGQFTNRLLLATTDLLGSNARATIEAQATPASFRGRTDLDALKLDWPANPAALLRARPARPAPNNPYPHQKNAIEDVIAGFQTADRGRLTMACGTGKTLVGVWVARALAAESTLVLLPSLSLLSQTYSEWCRNDDPAQLFKPLFVCSNQMDAARKPEYDSGVARVRDLPLPTTDAAAIRDFLRAPGRKVVFSTYQSSPEIARAMRPENGEAPPPFDLIIADEAHRCVGRVDTAFGTVLDAKKIPARRRLFMTATERVLTLAARTRHEAAGWDTASMDDAARFGPRFHQLSFIKAIAYDLLTDYQVVILVIDDQTYRGFVDRGRFVDVDGMRATDARSLAQQIALAKLMADPQYQLRRVVSFHSRIETAKKFADEFPQTVASLGPADRPSGEIRADYVTGEMTTTDRALRIDRLKDEGIGKRVLLTNARCLTEGVDIPSLDGIVFVDPKSSPVDIVQAVGRAIRNSKTKTVGTILIPVVTGHGVDPEAALAGSAFEPVWSVLRALRLHDEAFAEELDLLRRALGKPAGRGAVQLPAKLHINLPAHLQLTAFSKAISYRLVEATTSSWEQRYGELQVFLEQNPRGTALLLAKRRDGTRSSLGEWVEMQRQAKRKNTLSNERIVKLNLVGMVWDQHEANFAEGVRQLELYKASHGGRLDFTRDYKTPDGFKLGSWLTTKRSAKNSNPTKLSEERTRVLDALGVTWSTSDRGLRELKKYANAHSGDANPKTNYETADGYKLGNWLKVQRDKKREGSLSADMIRALDELHVNWNPPGGIKPVDGQAKFEANLNLLISFRKKYPTRWPGVKELYKGKALGTWFFRQRGDLRKKLLSPERVVALSKLGNWEEVISKFDRYFEVLVAYLTGHSGRWPLRKDRYLDLPLGEWLAKLRKNRTELSPEQLARLNELGFDWDPRATAFDEAFNLLVSFREEYPDRWPRTGETYREFPLGQWSRNIRSPGRCKSVVGRRRLSAIGFPWEVEKTSRSSAVSKPKS